MSAYLSPLVTFVFLGMQDLVDSIGIAGGNVSLLVEVRLGGLTLLAELR